MSRPATPLLTYLRRHRGLWALAVLVLLFKLASSTICLADRPVALAASAPVGSAMLVASDAQVDDGCLLGEAGDCHCACAHSLTVASSAVALLPPLPLAPLHAARLAADHLPAFAGSLLRPPIA